MHTNLEKVITETNEKMNSNVRKASCMADRITSARNTYVCHNNRYNAANTDGMVNNMDTTTPITRSVRLPFCPGT